MRYFLCALLLALSALARSHAFVVTAPAARSPALSGMSTGPALREGSFVSSLHSTASLTTARGQGSVGVSRRRTTRGELRMGKASKFGIFSPAVIAAKVALGETRLNKIRGKVIALHSQVIKEYCGWVGAPPKVKGLLIRKAKMNGDDLGFLW